MTNYDKILIAKVEEEKAFAVLNAFYELKGHISGHADKAFLDMIDEMIKVLQFRYSDKQNRFNKLIKP
jgi:hypothetical protein